MRFARLRRALDRLEDCETHGHDYATKSEEPHVRRGVLHVEANVTVHSDAERRYVRNRYIHNETADCNVYYVETVKECRFCGKTQTIDCVKWYLPTGSSAGIDEPLENDRDSIGPWISEQLSNMDRVEYLKHNSEYL